MSNVVGILFKQNTVIKQSTGASDQLPSNQRQNVPVGTFLILQSYSDPPIDNHYKISLKNLQFKGYNTWYAYAPHVQVSQQPLRPRQTVAEVVSKQTEKNVAKIIVDKNTVPAQLSSENLCPTLKFSMKIQNRQSPQAQNSFLSLPNPMLTMSLSFQLKTVT